MKTGKKMKALSCFALLIVVLMTCNCLAFAEEVLKLDWTDLVTTEIESQGNFQTIEITDQPSVRIWIPSEMASVDTSFMDGPFKPIALYGTADQSRSVILFVSEVASLDEYVALMEKESGGSEFRHILINGVDCIVYEVEKDGIESIIYPVSDHVILSINLMPMTGDDNWEATKNNILASIQLAE